MKHLQKRGDHMKKTLKEFILEWNEAHKHFTFSLHDDPTINRPTGISVRYPACKYQKLYSLENWEKFLCLFDAKAHGTMFISTDKHLFENGIIELNISCQNHNYQEYLIISVLKWIGEEFFSDDAND